MENNTIPTLLKPVAPSSNATLTPFQGYGLYTDVEFEVEVPQNDSRIAHKRCLVPQFLPLNEPRDVSNKRQKREVLPEGVLRIYNELKAVLMEEEEAHRRGKRRDPEERFERLEYPSIMVPPAPPPPTLPMLLEPAAILEMDEGSKDDTSEEHREEAREETRGETQEDIVEANMQNIRGDAVEETYENTRGEAWGKTREETREHTYDDVMPATNPSDKPNEVTVQGAVQSEKTEEMAVLNTEQNGETWEDDSDVESRQVQKQLPAYKKAALHCIKCRTAHGDLKLLMSHMLKQHQRFASVYWRCCNLQVWEASLTSYVPHWGGVHGWAKEAFPCPKCALHFKSIPEVRIHWTKKHQSSVGIKPKSSRHMTTKASGDPISAGQARKSPGDPTPSTSVASTPQGHVDLAPRQSISVILREDNPVALRPKSPVALRPKSPGAPRPKSPVAPGPNSPVALRVQNFVDYEPDSSPTPPPPPSIPPPPPSILPPPPPLPSTLQLYCRNCSLDLKDLKDLVSHMTERHRKELDTVYFSCCPPPDRRYYKATSNSFAHMQDIHDWDKRTPFPCHECGAPFFDLPQVVEHIQNMHRTSKTPRSAVFAPTTTSLLASRPRSLSTERKDGYPAASWPASSRRGRSISRSRHRPRVRHELSSTSDSRSPTRGGKSPSNDRTSPRRARSRSRSRSRSRPHTRDERSLTPHPRVRSPTRRSRGRSITVSNERISSQQSRPRPHARHESSSRSRSRSPSLRRRRGRSRSTSGDRASPRRECSRRPRRQRSRRRNRSSTSRSRSLSRSPARRRRNRSLSHDRSHTRRDWTPSSRYRSRSQRRRSTTSANDRARHPAFTSRSPSPFRHPPKSTSLLPPSSTLNIHCDVCSQDYATIPSLTDHLYVAHANYLPKLRWTCCATQGGPLVMLRHLRAVHSWTGALPCPEVGCRRSFERMPEWHQHAREHVKEKRLASAANAANAYKPPVQGTAGRHGGGVRSSSRASGSSMDISDG